MADTETIYHGAHTRFSLHIGQCWTDSERCARSYSEGGGHLASVEIDWSDLNVEWLEVGYDRENDEAPGDRDADLAEYASAGIDVIWYDDEDKDGREHQTYRIVSQAALAAFGRAIQP